VLIPEKIQTKKELNPMKLTSLLLTAALSLAAASSYAQAAQSFSAVGASASPSTPPTCVSDRSRDSIVEKEVVEAAEAMPEDKFDFLAEKLNLPGADYKGAHVWPATKRCRLELLDLVTITGRNHRHGHDRKPGQYDSQADIVKYLKIPSRLAIKR